MVAARTAGLKTARTAKSKAAMVNLTTNRTKTPRADPTATSKAAMVDPTTNRTKTPRAGTDDRTTPTEATGEVMVNPTLNRTKPPRATTGDLETATGAVEEVMVDPTTTPTLDQKPPTEATPLVKSRRMITLTEATRKATVDPMTTLAPMADRRNAAAVRGAIAESLTFADFLQGMAVPEAIVLNGMTTTAPMTPALTVRDTNPRISRRKTLTPLVTPTPPVIPTPGEAMAAVVRRKAGTPPAVMGEAISLMEVKGHMEELTSPMEVTSLTEEAINPTGEATNPTEEAKSLMGAVTGLMPAPNEAVTAETVVKVTMKNVVVTRTARKKVVATRIARKKVVAKSITRENVAVRRIATTMTRPMAPGD